MSPSSSPSCGSLSPSPADLGAHHGEESRSHCDGILEQPIVRPSSALAVMTWRDGGADLRRPELQPTGRRRNGGDARDHQIGVAAGVGSRACAAVSGATARSGVHKGLGARLPTEAHRSRASCRSSRASRSRPQHRTEGTANSRGGGGSRWRPEPAPKPTEDAYAHGTQHARRRAGWRVGSADRPSWRPPDGRRADYLFALTPTTPPALPLPAAGIIVPRLRFVGPRQVIGGRR